jgi:hypothetical protein
MHVQSSSLPAFNANIRAAKPNTIPVSEIKLSQVELEEMLGNLRADPIIGSRILKNDDGTCRRFRYRKATRNYSNK